MTIKIPPLTPMICAYPECSNMFWITVQQKRELKTYNVLKYGDSHDPYCSIECQQKHLKDLAESEFLDKSTLKNREYALVVHGVDVTRRPKEKEVIYITGNFTEQRTGCVMGKLLSMSERRIKLSKENNIRKMRYLTPKEIQEFLLTGINAKLKVNPSRIQVTASEIMTETYKRFPDLVSIEWINEKDRVLISIK